MRAFPLARRRVIAALPHPIDVSADAVVVGELEDVGRIHASHVSSPVVGMEKEALDAISRYSVAPSKSPARAPSGSATSVGVPPWYVPSLPLPVRSISVPGKG